jgi:hypothetical protein
MAAMLPGIGFRDPQTALFAFDAPSYTQIVTDTLGNHGLPGDDLEVKAQELSDLMDAFTADVTSDTSIDNLPDGKIWQPTIDVLTAIGIEIDVADATSAAIGGAFDALAAGIGVWGILDVAVILLTSEINIAVRYIEDQISFILTNLGGFGGGGGVFGF